MWEESAEECYGKRSIGKDDDLCLVKPSQFQHRQLPSDALRSHADVNRHGFQMQLPHLLAQSVC